MFKHPSLSTLATALLICWAAGASAQTTGDPTLPPLPPAPQSDAPQQQQATAPATDQTGTFPALPLGRDGVSDVQNQLIALGFNPGMADGQPGPATIAAAEQYNEDRGGSGPVPIDGALLARLQQDTAPRLTPQQVAARSQPRYRAQAPSNPLVGAVHQFESGLRGLFNGGH